MTDQTEQPDLIPDPTPGDPSPTPDPTPPPAPDPQPAPPAGGEVVDPHAGFAVYDETLTRFVSEVFRDGKDNGKAAADADAKERRKTTKGHRFSVKSV